MLEWHAIASMVKFQGSRHGSVLLVEKEDFNAFEKKLENRIGWIIWIIGSYNTIKIAALAICLHFEKGSKDEFLFTVMSCDIVCMVTLFAYFFIVMAIL